MKKILILIFCFGAVALNALRYYLDHDVNLESMYSSNVLKLSDYDLNRFKSKLYEDKFKLKTSDDLINSARFRIELKNYWFAGHTQKHEFFFKYNSYLKNNFLNDGFLGYRFTQFLNRKINFNLSYFYYPRIYVNRYRSEVDAINVYRDFTYAKNDYQAEANWKTNQFMEVTYKFSLGQFFYNQYFTEYDAVTFDNRLALDFFPRAKIRPSGYYEYRVATAKGEDAFDDESQIETIKDFSYEANRYNLSLSVPRLLKINKRYLYFSTSLHYEQRYFQYDGMEDTYHYCREDYTLTMNGALSYRIHAKAGLRFSAKYQERNTRSPFSYVSRDKNYDLFEFGLRLSWKI
jgi:hypothetical protein